MNIEIIEEGDIELVPRGRASNVPKELVDALKKIGKGKAIRLPDMKLDAGAKTYKTDKARVSATIRQAGRQANVAVQICWSLQGMPQVIKK